MNDHRRRVFAACILASASALADDASFGPIGKDTLWTVAGKVNAERHLGTTAQVAWALYLKNPQAFDGSPSKPKASAMLAIPDAAAVTALSGKDAYAKLTGAPAVAPVAPVPARTAPRGAPVVPANPHAAPTVAGVELKPAAGGKQWFGVFGENFRPGARLDLHDMLNGRSYNGIVPAKVSAGRIDLQAQVGNAQSHWLVTVRNADGTASEAFGFAAGPGAVSTGEDPAAAAAVEVPKRAAEAEPAADAPLSEAEAAAARAALDREFEEKMAADRAAYDQQHPAKAKGPAKKR